MGSTSPSNNKSHVPSFTMRHVANVEKRASTGLNKRKDVHKESQKRERKDEKGEKGLDVE